MAKFPTYEEMAKKVAEKALDEFLYNGKSIREWIQIIASEDCISRYAVLDQTYLWSKDEFLRVTNPFDYLRKRINSLPSVTPQQKTGRWIIIDDCEQSSSDCNSCKYQNEVDGSNCYECVKGIRNNYTADSEKE